MATMEYMGYIAEIDYDPEIDSFMVNVVNLSSPVMFYGKTTDELKKEFAQSIQEWLDVCRERNIKPEKPYSGRLTVRMNPETHRAVAKAAANAGKSINTWIVESLSNLAKA